METLRMTGQGGYHMTWDFPVLSLTVRTSYFHTLAFSQHSETGMNAPHYEQKSTLKKLSEKPMACEQEEGVASGSSGNRECRANSNARLPPTPPKLPSCHRFPTSGGLIHALDSDLGNLLTYAHPGPGPGDSVLAS